MGARSAKELLGNHLAATHQAPGICLRTDSSHWSSGSSHLRRCQSELNLLHMHAMLRCIQAINQQWNGSLKGYCFIDLKNDEVLALNFPCYCQPPPSDRIVQSAGRGILYITIKKIPLMFESFWVCCFWQQLNKDYYTGPILLM